MFRRMFRVMLPLVVIAAWFSVRFERPLFAVSVTLTPSFDVTTDGVNIFDGPYLRTGNLTGLGENNDEPPPYNPPPFYELRSILKFNVSSIPSNATINTVTLKITQQNLHPQGLTSQYPDQYGGNEIRGLDTQFFSIDPVETASAADLYEASQPWNSAVFVSRFSEDGPSPYPNVPGTFTFVTGGPNVFPDLKTYVQGWVNGTRVNEGLTVKEESTGYTLTGRQFVSSNVNTPITGDANFDGVVNNLDVQAWQASFRFQNGNVAPTPADFDTDWDVDGNDFLRLQRGMGSVAGAGPGPLAPMLIIDYTPAGVGSGSAVPEPAAVILACFGSFVAFSLSRRGSSRSRER